MCNPRLGIYVGYMSYKTLHDYIRSCLSLTIFVMYKNDINVTINLEDRVTRANRALYL